jgi:hypothetical protein
LRRRKRRRFERRERERGKRGKRESRGINIYIIVSRFVSKVIW